MTLRFFNDPGADDVLLFGGIAVAGTGVVLFFLDQGADSDGATAGFACVPGACAGNIAVKF